MTQVTYNDFPTPPTTTPRYKGWDDIKRRSDSSSSLMSLLSATTKATPLLPPSAHHFTPPVPRRKLTPPPPLKKRSLIQLRRKTPLAGTGQPVTMATPFSPLTVNTKFTAYDKGDVGFEGPRMRLLAKVNSMGDLRGEEERGGRGQGVGVGARMGREGKVLGYRDSVLRMKEKDVGLGIIGRWSQG